MQQLPASDTKLSETCATFLSQKYLLFVLLATAAPTRGRNCAITASGGQVHMLYRASGH